MKIIITYQQLKTILKKLSDLSKFELMKNASPSQEDDGSMIKYWEEQTGINLEGQRFKCPKCQKLFYRKGLDGSHIVRPNSNSPQFITPLCQKCNRSRDETSFKVEKRYIIPAP